MIKPEQQPKQEITSTPPVAEKPDVIPPQYKGMPSEVVEELWQNPVYVDAEKNKSETERRQRAIEAIKTGEENREAGKKKQLTERYAGLPNDQKTEFPNAQKDATRVLTEHIQGQRDIDNLSPEESFVLGKLKTAYEEFKKENPHKPFAFDFSKGIDRKVYNNLAQRLAFKVLEGRQNLGDQEKANAIRTELGIPPQEVKKEGLLLPEEKSEQTIKTPEVPNLEERKKLHGWNASYELAKIAKTQGIDLSSISREEYVQFAIDNSLAIDDDQLRMAPWQRMATSIEQLLAERKRIKSEIRGSDIDKAFTKFNYDIKNRAGEQDRFIGDKVRVRSGTKDSQSWLFFGINNGIDEQSNETYKAYISVRDIKTLTPDRFKLFMETLQKNQYNGDVKIFQDPAEQGVVLNDQVVMHGRSQADAELALQVAKHFFEKDLGQEGLGKDEIINGKNQSYSQILADKIQKEIFKK
jgi:hypothetical protein